MALTRVIIGTKQEALQGRWGDSSTPRGRQDPGHTAEGLQPVWSDARAAPSSTTPRMLVLLPQFPNRTVLLALPRTLSQPGVLELLRQGFAGEGTPP